METTVWAVVAACLGSTGLFTLLGELLRARREKSDKKNSLKREIDEMKTEVSDTKKTCMRLEKDECRTQLLLMMSDYPDDRAEILQLGAHYFGDLDGDWYLSSMFAGWLRRQGLDKPDWFDKEAKT